MTHVAKIRGVKDEHGWAECGPLDHTGIYNKRGRGKKIKPGDVEAMGENVLEPLQKPWKSL